MRPFRFVVLTLAVGLWAVPALASGSHRTAAFLGVQGSPGVGATDTAPLEEALLTALSANGFFTRVTGKSDIAALLGLERMHQLAGCSESSCLTEIAGALGVDYLVSATAGRLGGVTVLNLKVIDVGSAEVAARALREVRRPEELAGQLERLASDVVEPLRAYEIRVGRAAPPPALGLAFLPLGVGQFAVGSPVRGTLFAAGEIAAFATFGVALDAFESSKLPGSGGLFEGGTFADPQAARRLESTYLAAFWTGVALYGLGVVEALVERQLAER